MKNSYDITIPKIAVLLFSLIMSSISSVLSTKAVLGTSPITAVPFVISSGTDLSFGTAIFIFNIILALMGIVVMGHNYKLFYLLTVPTVLLFSCICDIFTAVFCFIDVSNNYLGQWILVILSSITLAIGLAFNIASSITMLPADFFVRFVNVRSRVNFGTVKLIFDVILVIIAALLSMSMLGEIIGIREGTLFIALTVGPMTKYLLGLLTKIGFMERIGQKDIDIS